MNVFDAIHTRRSIRKYLPTPVTADLIDTLLKAGMAAPSAGNQQPWHFIVITNRAKLSAIPVFHPYSKMVEQTPVAILVCGAPEGKRYPTFWTQDTSAATQNILLAARGLGLGSVWVGIYPEENRMAGFRTLFNLPEQIIPFSLIPIGWPDGNFSTRETFRPELVHQEAWKDD